MASSNTDTKAANRPSLLARLFSGVLKLVIVLAFIATGMLIGGFAKFSTDVAESHPPQNVPPADAIVVLTGGSERISAALELLAQDRNRRLLISGVNPTTSAAALSELHPEHQDLIACCVDLDSASMDTISNAVETRKWMAQNGHASLILVTSAYHMPRSRMEFARQMPGIEVYSWPVALDELNREDWWKDPATLRLMISEYIKYVGAWSRDFVKPDVFDSVRSSLFS
jgi:uncharacterized SAM-binding protein YcdF (DUF218 family)